MRCVYCRSTRFVKNGKSRHGHQRWKCRGCGKTFGDYDRRKISGDLRAAALERYIAGTGLRATERVVGVSHNAVMDWAFQKAREQFLERTKDETVEWMTHGEMSRRILEAEAGSSGILLVLPAKFAAGQWALVTPRRQSMWMRKFLRSMLAAIE
jgi:transposase-like protein